MLHPFLDPHHSLIPARAVFRQGPSTGGAGGSTSVENLTNSLPAAGSAEELRLRLAALDQQVSQEEARKQLEGLKGGMELQQEAQQQESREVQYILSKLEGKLENAPERTSIMSSIQNRLTLELAVLVEDGEITEGQLSQNSLEATLNTLKGKAGSIKVRSAAGERNLYAHEQSVLNIPGLLKNHSNEEVKKAWEQMSQSMQHNVQLMRASSRLVSGKNPEQSLTGSMSEGLKNAWNGVVDRWKNGSNMDKAMIIAGGAAAVGLLFSLGKKLFGSNESGSRSGSLLGILGVGAAIAGGVYLYNRLMNPMKAYEKLKDLIPNMNQEQFTRGLRAHLAGDEAGARAAWGTSYDTLSSALGRRPQTKSPERSQSTVDEDGVEWVEPREAISNYMEGMKEAMLPMTAWMQDHSLELSLIGSYVLIKNFDAVKGGLTMTKESIVGYGVYMKNHPLKALFGVTAFIMLLKEADNNLKLPKNGAEMKKFLQAKRTDLVSYLHREGFGDVPQDHIDAAADIIAGEKSVTDYKDQFKDIADQAVVALAEKLRLSPEEKIRQENIRGLESFSNQIKILGKHNSPEGKAVLLKAELLVSKMQTQQDLSREDIQALENLAKPLNIHFLIKDGYVFYGEKNAQGEWMDATGAKIEEGDLRCLSVDPSLDKDRQLESANHFSPVPGDISSAFMGGFVRRPYEQVRNTGAYSVEKLREGIIGGTLQIVFLEGGSYVLDGVSKKYVEVPLSLVRMVASPLTGEEFTAKEFLFTYGEGMLPVLVLGAASSLVNFRMPFKGGVFKAVLETGLYPIKGTAESWRLTKTKIYAPFMEGVRSAEGVGGRLKAGVESVYNLNKGRLIERSHLMTGHFRALLTRSDMIEVIRSQDALREALSHLRAGEGAFRQRAKVDLAKKILANASSGELRVVEELLDSGNIQRSTDVVLSAIEYYEDLEKGISSMKSLKSGTAIAPSELENLRKLAKNDAFEAIFKNTLGRMKLASPTELDTVRNLLRGEESLDALADGLKRAGLIADNIEDLKVLFKAEEAAESAGKLRRVLDFTIDMLSKGGALTRDGAVWMWKALSGERASAAYRRAWEGISSLPGMTQEKLSTLVEGIRNSEKWSDLKSAFRSSEVIALDATAEAVDGAMDLARTADLLKDADLMKDTFAAIRAGEGVDIVKLTKLDDLLRTVEGTEEASKVLREMGMVDDQIEATIRAFKTAESPAGLADVLKRTGLIAAADIVPASRAALEGVETASRTIKNLDTALDAIKNGREISYLQLRALQQAAQGSDFKLMLRNAEVAAEQVDVVADLLKTQKELGALADGLKATEALKLGKGVRGLIAVARIGGPALAVGGVVAGGFEAHQAHMMANLFQSNKELSDIYRNKRNANIAAALASFTIDVAAIAGSRYGTALAASALGRGVAYVGGAAALPLTVIIENIRYVYSAASDASQEIARTDDDWLKEASQKGFTASGVDAKEWSRLIEKKDQLDEFEMKRLSILSEQIKDANKQYLLHALVNTGVDTGAGEAYNAIFTTNEMDQFRDGRQETVSKILSALIKLDTGNKPAPYNQYRMKYINAKVSSFDDIEKARKVLDTSILFADVMQNRDQVLSYDYSDGGKRTINLRDEKFDADKIQIGEVFAVMSTVEQLNDNALKAEIGEKLYERVTGLDKNYLNYAVNVMMLYTQEKVVANPTASLNEKDLKIQKTAEMMRRYLLMNGYQFTNMPNLSNPSDHMEDINKVIFDESSSDESITDAMAGYVPRSKGVAALYVYAQATGYKGSANIGSLEKYFTPEKADWIGIYYNKDADLPGGGEWVVSEEGIESDNEAGSNPDTAVLKMIEYIKEDPGNILTSRFDYITDLTTRDDQKRREKWMLELARRMERAYEKSSAPASTQEYQGSTSVISNLLDVDTWKESLGETAETIGEGITTAVTSTRDAISSTLSSAGDTISSLGSAIGGLFSSDDDED